MSSFSLSRRDFMISAAAVGGGLTLGFHIPMAADAAPAAGRESAPEINAWIVIRPDETVIIRVARSEMGQGALTALPMLVAEELECDWAKVKAEYASPAENVRRGRVFGDMSTNASRSVSASQSYLRRAGATAREMLIAAAAQRWKVPAGECRARNSLIKHLPSGRSITFGAVARAAAHLPPPAQVTLKEPKDWKLIGTPRRRLDVRAKVTGRPVYGIDVRLPNMLYAAIAQCPVFQGTLHSVDEARLMGMKGVRRVVKIPGAVAVVADSWWQAKRALDSAGPVWDAGRNGNVSSKHINEQIRLGLNATRAGIGRRQGDVEAGLAQAERRIEAEYAVPFLAHATLEPQNCTAHVTAERVEVWAPTQDGEAALAAAADAAGVSPSKVVLHKTMLGGGFGRRGTVQDFVRQAVLIAKEISRPVKLVWTREEDTEHDLYRPVAMARLVAGLDAAGMPLAWSIRLSGQSLLGSIAPELMHITVDRSFMQGLLEDMAYEVLNYQVDFAPRETHVPIGVLRGVNYTQNTFFKESFVDEMAYAAGIDPYLFRRRLLRNKPKHLAVLDAVAAKANWAMPAAPDVFRGIALNEACGSICAQVVEASVDARGAVRVHRVISAIDCGHVVNPLTVELQTQSAVAYALTATLYGEITIENGRVAQSNFHDYEMLRIHEMPRVETVLVPSGGFWGGVGEPPATPLPPALCNAIFAATGRRIRTLPLKNHDLRREPATWSRASR